MLKLLTLTALSCLVSACKEGTCPTIDCEPKIVLSMTSAVQNPYAVMVSVADQTLSAQCPQAADPSKRHTARIDSCDSSSVVVSGVDLGMGANQTVLVRVSISGGAPLSATAQLTGITNSRDCVPICFVHEGTIPN
jgi:hypothetical protein